MGVGNVQYAYLIGKETGGFGVTATADKDVGVVTELTREITYEPIEVAGIGNVEQEANLQGMKSVTENVTLQYQHARIFTFIIGNAAHAASSSDYVHTFSVGSTAFSYSSTGGSNIVAGDVGHTFVGNKIDSAELSWAINEPLSLSFTSMGKKGDTVTTVPAHTISTLATFPHKLLNVKLNGVAPSQCQSGKFTFTKTLEPSDGIGSDEHADIVLTGLRSTFEVTLAFDDSTYHDHFHAKDVTAVSFVASNNVASGSGKRALEFALDTIALDKFTEVAKVPGLTIVTVGGRGNVSSFVSTDNISGANWL